MRLSSHDLASAAGITYRQLDHWVRTGLVGSFKQGSGNSRLWGMSDVERVLRMAALTRLGLTPTVAHRAVTDPAFAAELCAALGGEDPVPA